MATPPGTYPIGPDKATLSVHTGRQGAVAKAGHDLLIHVTDWHAKLELGEDGVATSIELGADPTSLRVREGTGGIQALDDGDLANIEQTIDDEVLERKEIGFRSTAIERGRDAMRVEGELTLAGQTAPIAFDLVLGEDGSISGVAVVKQSNWGMTPYSALFGALKVKDEVEVRVEGHL